MNSALRYSKHLHIIERPSQFHIAYHKLFGNLTFLNDSALHLLKVFRNPPPLEEVNSKYAAYSEQVNYFYNLYFLVSGDHDERSELKADLTRRSEELREGKFLGGLQLCVSEACNFKCNYCFCDSVDERGDKRIELSNASEKVMSFETAVQTIDKLIAHVRDTSRNALSIRFFGREPLTNWAVIEKVLHHYGASQGAGVSLQYSITTNGSLITDKIAATLAQFNVHTTVSIDGLEHASNINRLTILGQSTFATAKRGIENLAAHKPVNVVSAVITAQNFDSFDRRFVEFAHKNGAKEIQILLGMQGDFIKEIKPHMVTAKLVDLYVCGSQLGVAVTGYWYNSLPVLFHTRKLRTDRHVQRGVGNSCSATGHQISVEPSGDIFPCRAMSTHLGHISALDEMLRSKTYGNLVMRTYNNVEDCQGCEIEGFCQGECSGNSEKSKGDMYKIDGSYCDIYRGVNRSLLDMWQGSVAEGRQPGYHSSPQPRARS